jgi:hypothetical protein
MVAAIFHFLIGLFIVATAIFGWSSVMDEGRFVGLSYMATALSALLLVATWLAKRWLGY